MRIDIVDSTEIATIDGILTEEDADTLHSYAKWVKESGIFEENLADQDTQDFQPDPYDDGFDLEEIRDFWGEINVYVPLAPQEIRDIVARLTLNVSAAFDEYLQLLDQPDTSYNTEDLIMAAIHVYRGGIRLDLHQDCHDYAFVVYLTGSDQYTGGELVYPDLGIRHLPTKCSLLIAPSALTHEVLPITSGTRCSLTAFIPVSR